MSTAPKGRADYLELGTWNAVCFECGCKRKGTYLQKHWKGYWVCPEHWEPREAQDFVRAVFDDQIPQWTQPQPSDTFINVCTPNGSSALPFFAQPGCCIPGFISPFFDPFIFEDSIGNN